MSKHTPGPWVVAGYAVDTENGSVFDLAVCHKARVGGYWSGSDYASPSHWEANAHLIAAAPELLEALEGLRDFCEQAGFPCDRANRVIAKAKGEAA